MTGRTIKTSTRRGKASRAAIVRAVRAVKAAKLKLRCKLQMCGCLPKSDDKGCWAECITCGKESAYIDRRILRSYIELEEAHQRHLEVVADVEEKKNDKD